MTGASELDDAAVIRASLRAPEQFGVIFDRHAAHIHRYLARRLGRQVADDVLSETFLAAFGGRGRYDAGRRDARPWLYRDRLDAGTPPTRWRVPLTREQVTAIAVDIAAKIRA